MNVFVLVIMLVLALCGRSAVVQEEETRDLATKGTITTGYWPGGIPPWKGEENNCRQIFPSMNTDNPCVSCRSGSYCSCKYVYPGPAPKMQCVACKTSNICPGNGKWYPPKKPPAATDVMSYLRGSSSADAQSADGSWQSFPTPGPKVVKQNPNAKCQLNVFGRCNSGDYCKSVSYDQYRCTKCEKNKKCTGDGRMGPP